jgi:hypothetical protein
LDAVSSASNQPAHDRITPSVCPECGASLAAPPSAARSRIVAMCRWLPWLGLLAAFGVLIGGTLSVQRRSGLGFTSQWMCPAGLRATELAAIASGERDGKQVMTEFARYKYRPWVLGPESVHVGWMAPAGVRYEWTAWGRPWGCLFRERAAQYEDALTQQSPTPRDWGVMRRSFWTGTIWYGPGPSGTSSPSYDAYWCSMSGLAPFALLALAAGYLGQIALGLVATIRGRPPPRRLRARLLSAGLFLLVFIAVGAAFPSTTVSYSLGGIVSGPTTLSATPAVDADTGWKVNDLLAAAHDPDGARLIAQHLSSILPPPPDAAMALVVGVQPIPGRVGSSVRAGWPFDWLWWDLETSPMTANLPRGRSRLEAHWPYTFISYVVGGTGELLDVSVRLDYVAFYALAAIAIWRVLRFLARLVEWRLIRRRRVQGLCMCCGYDLAGLHAPAAGQQGS